MVQTTSEGPQRNVCSLEEANAGRLGDSLDLRTPQPSVNLRHCQISKFTCSSRELDSDGTQPQASPTNASRVERHVWAIENSFDTRDGCEKKGHAMGCSFPKANHCTPTSLFFSRVQDSYSSPIMSLILRDCKQNAQKNYFPYGTLVMN